MKQRLKGKALRIAMANKLVKEMGEYLKSDDILIFANTTKPQGGRKRYKAVWNLLSSNKWYRPNANRFILVYLDQTTQEIKYVWIVPPSRFGKQHTVAQYFLEDGTPAPGCWLAEYLAFASIDGRLHRVTDIKALESRHDSAPRPAAHESLTLGRLLDSIDVPSKVEA